jgi:hypothetical protein
MWTTLVQFVGRRATVQKVVPTGTQVAADARRALRQMHQTSVPSLTWLSRGKTHWQREIAKREPTGFYHGFPANTLYRHAKLLLRPSHAGSPGWRDTLLAPLIWLIVARKYERDHVKRMSKSERLPSQVEAVAKLVKWLIERRDSQFCNTLKLGEVF